MIDFSQINKRKESEQNTYYLLIAGSRGFEPDGSQYYSMNGKETLISNIDIAEMFIKKALSKHIDANHKIVIVEGEARGADKVGKLIGKRNNWDVHEFPAKWSSYGKSAGYRRNSDMILHIGQRPNKGCFLFWDGESKGTQHMLYLAVEWRVDVRVYNYIQRRFLTKDEIDKIYEDVNRTQTRYV